MNEKISNEELKKVQEYYNNLTEDEKKDFIGRLDNKIAELDVPELAEKNKQRRELDKMYFEATPEQRKAMLEKIESKIAELESKN